MVDWTYSGLDIGVDYAGTKSGLFFVSNNVWNKGSLIAGKDFTQSINFTPNFSPSGTMFNWDWGSSSEIRSYPEVIWGMKFEYGAAQKAIKVENLLSLAAAYNFQMSGDTSKYNVAFSIWTQSEIGGRFETVRSENMIWVHSNGWKPTPSFSYVAPDDRQADIYINTDWGDHSGVHPNGWTYSATIFKQDLLSGTLNLAAILKELIWRGAINPSDYISGVELGTEIAGGRGSFTINNLSYDLTSKLTTLVSGSTSAKALGLNTADGITIQDSISYEYRRDALEIDKVGSSVYLRRTGASDTLDILKNFERIDLVDGDFIYDIASARAPAAYQLYGGAFDRTPDEGGFRYWTRTLDAGVSLHDVANSFIVSNEFKARYGVNLSNAAFVDALYLNVLNRPGEAAGVAYWNDVLNKKLGDRADVLVNFTQLPEYVSLSLKDIENGYWVV